MFRDTPFLSDQASRRFIRHLEVRSQTSSHIFETTQCAFNSITSAIRPPTRRRWSSNVRIHAPTFCPVNAYCRVVIAHLNGSLGGLAPDFRGSGGGLCTNASKLSRTKSARQIIVEIYVWKSTRSYRSSLSRPSSHSSKASSTRNRKQKFFDNCFIFVIFPSINSFIHFVHGDAP